MSFNWISSAEFIAQGAIVTLKYTVISVTGGVVLGLLLALAKLSHRKWLQLAARFYTSVFRGTPLLLQLFIVYFGIPNLTGYQISIFESGIIAFSLNSAAYMSETMRAGIEAIDKGQFEAAHVLGISRFHTMRDIILPQAVRNILPALVNEMISMLKETALISTLGEMDIMKRANEVAAESYHYFEPLLVAALCYYILVLCLTQVLHYIEKRQLA